jgi:hypothetical protein
LVFTFHFKPVFDEDRLIADVAELRSSAIDDPGKAAVSKQGKEARQKRELVEIREEESTSIREEMLGLQNSSRVKKESEDWRAEIENAIAGTDSSVKMEDWLNEAAKRSEEGQVKAKPTVRLPTFRKTNAGRPKGSKDSYKRKRGNEANFVAWKPEEFYFQDAVSWEDGERIISVECYLSVGAALKTADCQKWQIAIDRERDKIVKNGTWRPLSSEELAQYRRGELHHAIPCVTLLSRKRSGI